MSIVKQADAEATQSLVGSKIEAKAEAETAGSRPKTQLNPETKTDEIRSGTGSRATEAEPTDEAEQSEPEEPTDNNPEEIRK